MTAQKKLEHKRLSLGVAYGEPFAPTYSSLWECVRGLPS